MLLAVLACAHAPQRRAAGDEARIRERLRLWIEQFNSGDYLGAASIWAPDLIGVVHGGPDDSYDREQAGAEWYLHMRSPVRVALTVDEVLVDGDLAVVRDTWRETGGKKDETFRSLEVWRLQPDGQWKIARFINSAPDP
jgi:ketosteroid isomerase-like protein